jgi:hypothetical protein
LLLVCDNLSNIILIENGVEACFRLVVLFWGTARRMNGGNLIESSQSTLNTTKGADVVVVPWDGIQASKDSGLGAQSH